MRKFHVTAKLVKCKFLQTSLRYVGHIVSKDRIKPDPEKLSVEKMPEPTDITTLRIFLGLVGYYRKFIKDFAKIATPMTDLLKADFVWEWNSECQQAFQDL